MGRSLSIFDEQYRVVAIEGDRLFIRGILSGEVIAILNPEPETPSARQTFHRKADCPEQPSRRPSELRVGLSSNLPALLRSPRSAFALPAK